LQLLFFKKIESLSYYLHLLFFKKICKLHLLFAIASFFIHPFVCIKSYLSIALLQKMQT
jgi:hypothetical protein